MYILCAVSEGLTVDVFIYIVAIYICVCSSINIEYLLLMFKVTSKE